MPFVLDASMTLSWCFVNESTPHSRNVLAGLHHSYAWVPSLWLFEVTNVLAIHERRNRITQTGSQEFLQSLAALDIRIDPQTHPAYATNLLALTRRHSLTAYDAAYLELALRTALPLATLDQELLRAASQEGVTLLAEP